MSLLELVDLTIEYGASPEPVRSLDGVNFVMSPGEIVALVGESGSGKSTLAAAVGHLPIPGMRRVSGQVRIGGREVASLDRQNLQALRRNVLGYIFQDPVASLDPTMKLSRQVELALDIGPAEAAAALDGFGFADVVRVLRSYPHEVSGGMAQRVTIAMVMRKRPRLVVADEPTAALDAPVRAQILDLLVGGCRRLGAALLLVTHDLQTVRSHADRMDVMYAGRIVESGPTAEVLARPRHPYTAALLAAAVGAERPGERVIPISGLPPHISGRQGSCAFAPRCRFALDICRSQRPEARAASRSVLCHRAEEILT